MKVGIFNVTLTYAAGGSESYVWNLAEYLVHHDIDCDLWGGSVPNPQVLHPNIKLRTARFRPREQFSRLSGVNRKLCERLTFAWHCRRQIIDARYDVLSIHKPYDIPAALWFRRKTGCRIVWRCHGRDFYPGLNYLIRKVDRIYCVSQYAKNVLEKAYPVDAEVIHTGVDTDLFNPIRVQRKPRPTPTIIYFGRLVGWKGVIHFINALGQLGDIEWTARIIGNGPARDSLITAAQSLRLGDRVCFEDELNSRCAVREALAEADIVVFPSNAVETFSNALLEAMSMQKAVVATNAGGFTEAIQNDRNGLLVRPGNSDELAAAIRRYCTDPELRSRNGENARRTVVYNFSAQQSFAKVVRLFEDVLES